MLYLFVAEYFEFEDYVIRWPDDLIRNTYSYTMEMVRIASRHWEIIFCLKKEKFLQGLIKSFKII